MKRMHTDRAAAALIGIVAATPALAADGAITADGWWSMLVVVGIAGALVVVHKKLT